MRSGGRTSGTARIFDALVVGAGFGGLGAALALTEGGADVCVCEALRYPGGCASTFERGGYRFDAGATLMSGLGPGQPFGDWLAARGGGGVTLDWIDPLVTLRTGDLTLVVGRDRDAFVRGLCAMPGADPARIHAFFAEQRRVADVLWRLFDDPASLPPLGARALAKHAARVLDYAPLLPLLGRPLSDVLARHGLADFEPLRIYADALCQITVQCPASEAEAPFALAAMDYYHRGTAHVRGGVGALAEALLSFVANEGGTVQLANRVRGLSRGADGVWSCETRRGTLRARTVIANVLPSVLPTLLDVHTPLPSFVSALSERVEEGWGAVMLYVVLRVDAGSGSGPEAHHLELVADVARPFTEGNHLFVSLSDTREAERAPAGHRVATISTHVPLARTRVSAAQTEAEVASYVTAVQARMRDTLRLRAPEVATAITHEMTASPRTFQRFTGRPRGAVGGVPRRAGLANYANLGPLSPTPGLWLVGDSVFPGQSALATAIGGARTAAAVLASGLTSPRARRISR